MKPLLNRLLMAYRPLYLHGLLMDGRSASPRDHPSTSAPLARQARRMLLIALADARHSSPFLRSRS
jgi:hypothetical protein